MRYLIVASLVLMLLPAVALADSKVRFFFSTGGYYPSYTHRYYPPTYASPYRPYRPHLGYYNAYHGRYAVPRVYTPYRYGDYRSDYFRHQAYQRDFDYRRGLYGYDRHYYGPAVERYHRQSRDFPSYHYDRREGYIREQQHRFAR